MGRACNRSFETRITGVMMRKIAILGAACCGLLSVYPSIRVSAQALHVPYQTFTLPNGLQVLLHEDHSVPLVSVNVWYHVGSSDEKPGRTGFAHLFEHIMFMGSQHVPTGEFDRLLEAAGGDNNGSTTEDRTNYYEDGRPTPCPSCCTSTRTASGSCCPRSPPTRSTSNGAWCRTSGGRAMRTVPTDRPRKMFSTGCIRRITRTIGR